MMTEQKTKRGTSSWKWPVIIVGALVVLMGTCAISALWGGLIGYGLGRITTNRSPHFEFDYEPFEFPEPMPPERMPPGRAPEIPEMPEMPFLGERAWLGVTFQMEEEGARLVDIIEGSPAEEAGLRTGDIITAVDGRRVTQARPLDELILRYDPGDRVELTVLRNGREREVTVRLASRQEMREQDMPQMPWWEG
jgi:membrane-associated protease RseP (regulator of RpoE activity)